MDSTGLDQRHVFEMSAKRRSVGNRDARTLFPFLRTAPASGDGDYRLRRGGRQLRKSVYGHTNAEVRAKMIKLQAQVDKGAQIPRGRFPILADYAERWPDQLQHRPSTVRRYGELLMFHIIPAIGQLQLTKIERPMSSR